jgi:hypothetical protein
MGPMAQTDIRNDANAVAASTLDFSRCSAGQGCCGRGRGDYRASSNSVVIPDDGKVAGLSSTDYHVIVDLQAEFT